MPDPVPQTTVVIAVWDDYVSPQLEEAVASVRGQDAAPIVVVDNASVVPLPELADARVVRAPARLSLGGARNLGLDQVSSPYVIFWDADDVMLPGTIAFLEAAMASNSELAAFAMAIVEEPSRVRHRWPRRSVGRLVRSPRACAFLHSMWSLYPSTGATIIRTQAARAAGGYGDSDSGEDWCLGVSLAFRAQMGWSERPGRLYRVHPGSIWAQNAGASDLLRHARAVRERIRSDPGVPGWARALLPLIWLGQHAAVAAHLQLEALRRLRKRTPHLPRR